MTKNEIIDWVNEIKKDGRLLSNCYVPINMLNDVDYETIISKRTLLVKKVEYQVKRLLFFTIDMHELLKQIGCMVEKEDVVVDLISRELDFFKPEFESIGLVKLAEMQRLSNCDVSQIVAERVLHYSSDIKCGNIALVGDAEEIYNILWSVFDTRISHLEDIHTLKQQIAAGEYVVYKDDKQKIVSLLQSRVENNKFYINQIYNQSSSDVIQKILLNQLGEYIRNGGKYIYSWVERNNIASQKFHKKFGMVPDGLVNLVYTNY